LAFSDRLRTCVLNLRFPVAVRKSLKNGRLALAWLPVPPVRHYCYGCTEALDLHFVLLGDGRHFNAMVRDAVSRALALARRLGKDTSMAALAQLLDHLEEGKDQLVADPNGVQPSLPLKREKRSFDQPNNMAVLQRGFCQCAALQSYARWKPRGEDYERQRGVEFEGLEVGNRCNPRDVRGGLDDDPEGSPLQNTAGGPAGGTMGRTGAGMPSADQAVRYLCAEINVAETLFPGADLRLIHESLSRKSD
jgi:hypothetical protein